MKCAYNDGLKVDYSGSLHISKGTDVDLVLRPEEIPSEFKDKLVESTINGNCGKLRAAALEVTDAVGGYIP